MIIFLYTLLMLFGFLFPVVILVYVMLTIWGNFMGAPYVPTSSKYVEEILKKAKLKKGQFLIELGSGDGRILIEAAKKYQISGLGVDIHPMLNFYAYIKARLAKINTLQFKTENFFKTDLTKADVIFMFLLPATLKKLKPKLEKECKKNTLIISHGFKIAGFEKYLVYKIDRNLYPTYYYKL